MSRASLPWLVELSRKSIAHSAQFHLVARWAMRGDTHEELPPGVRCVAWICGEGSHAGPIDVSTMTLVVDRNFVATVGIDHSTRDMVLESFDRIAPSFEKGRTIDLGCGGVTFVCSDALEVTMPFESHLRGSAVRRRPRAEMEVGLPGKEGRRIVKWR